jgi:hypothetical protein
VQFFSLLVLRKVLFVVFDEFLDLLLQLFIRYLCLGASNHWHILHILHILMVGPLRSALRGLVGTLRLDLDVIGNLSGVTRAVLVEGVYVVVTAVGVHDWHLATGLGSVDVVLGERLLVVGGVLQPVVLAGGD